MPQIFTGLPALVPFLAIFAVLWVGKQLVTLKYVKIPPVEAWHLGIPIGQNTISDKAVRWLVKLRKPVVYKGKQNKASRQFQPIEKHIVASGELALVRSSSPARGPMLVLGLANVVSGTMQFRLGFVHLATLMMQAALGYMVIPALVTPFLLLISAPTQPLIGRSLAIVYCILLLLGAVKFVFTERARLLAFLEEEATK